MIEDELPLKQRLNLETAKICWQEIETFFAKGTLLQVDKTEDLVTVAEYIASNNQSEIETLILNNKIAFATPDWVRNNCQPTTELWTVVVAPYVVCQLT